MCVSVSWSPPTDKQQEIDVPTLKVEDTDAHKKKEVPGKKAPMSQITGVRQLKHTNSFTGVIPKFGVETKNDEEITKVRIMGQFRKKCFACNLNPVLFL